MPAKVFKLGPGTLSLGTAGAVDISCQITNSVLTPDIDTDDPVTVLCGDVIPGATSYAWKLTGTLLTDLSAGGIAEYAFTNRNTIVEFEYTPNTAAGVSFTGSLTLHPIDIGGDSGKNLESDFEWPLVGDPVPAWQTPATNATYPATFTYPSSATFPKPADAPATASTSGKGRKSDAIGA